VYDGIIARISVLQHSRSPRRARLYF